MGLRETCLKQSPDIIIKLNAFRIQITVSGLIIEVGGTLLTIGVLVLDLGIIISFVPTERVAVCNLSLTGRALLGGDDDSTVGSIGTVQSGSGSAFQNGHRLDVIRVDIVTTGGEVHVIHQTHAVGDVGIGKAVGSMECGVVDGNTIHNIQRLVATGNRSSGTQNYRGGGTRSTAGGGDRHTGHTSLESAGKGFTTGVSNVFGLNALDRGTHGTGNTLHTEFCGNRSFLQTFGIFHEGNVDGSASAYGNILICIAKRRKTERSIAGDVDGIVTIQIGGNTVRGPLDHNGGTHDGFSASISDRSLHSDVLRKEACTDKQHSSYCRHTCHNAFLKRHK